MTNDIATIIAKEMNLLCKQVETTIKLLDDGATIPFISRYRKEATGSLDEVAILNISKRYECLTELNKRKKYIIATIKEQGALTTELLQKIDGVQDASELEDIYLPYKPKRRTRASIAREKGLEPLAKIIMAQNFNDIEQQAKRFITTDVKDVATAIDSALDIVAEWISENEKARSIVRARYNRNAVISSTVIKGKEQEGANYQNYFEFSQPLRLCSSHRLLAMRRGENEGYLKVRISIDDDEVIQRLSRLFIRPIATPDAVSLIERVVRDGYKRYIRPSIESEVSATSKEKADDAAIAMFADNVRQLLFAPPLGHKRVMGIDPGYRTGCKIVCLDEQGNLMHNEVIYPCPPRNDYKGASRKVCNLVEVYKIDAIAVGNGTAGRETEKFLSSLYYPRKVQVFSVNENGASVYSASKIAREEFPDKDVTVRGAVSIGRRLIDPLAELVKIDPKSIGVGQYQHDVDQAKLKKSLTYTVESCVNAVGVNVNTASRELLSYVSGIGPQLATNIVEYRAQHGDFKKRADLINVPRMGEKAYQQCAGFLRIPFAENILDNTAVHSESYYIVTQMANDLGCSIEELVKESSLREKVNISAYVTEKIGLPTLTDIMQELEKPGRDPRSVAKVFEFDEAVKDIKDLKPDMVLNGIVNNITAFGVFVDIGIKESGLIHISQLSNRFISSPSEVVKMHQHIKVKVISVDYERRRIALTIKDLNNE